MGKISKTIVYFLALAGWIGVLSAQAPPQPDRLLGTKDGSYELYIPTQVITDGGGADLSDNVPRVEHGTGAAGTAGQASRGDHIHPASGISNYWGTAPKVDAGAGFAGRSPLVSHGDHIHPDNSRLLAVRVSKVSAGSGSIGTQTRVAREDHAHPSDLPTITGQGGKVLTVNSGATGLEWAEGGGGGGGGGGVIDESYEFSQLSSDATSAQSVNFASTQQQLCTDLRKSLKAGDKWISAQVYAEGQIEPSGAIWFSESANVDTAVFNIAVDNVFDSDIFLSVRLTLSADTSCLASIDGYDYFNESSSNIKKNYLSVRILQTGGGGGGGGGDDPRIPDPTAAGALKHLRVSAAGSAYELADPPVPLTLSDSVPVVEAGTGVAGTGTTASRDDHAHPEHIRGLSDVVPLIESGSGTAGTAVSVSRGDHVHPEFGGGGSDVQLSNNTPMIESAAPVPGVGTKASRDDHVHPIVANDGTLTTARFADEDLSFNMTASNRTDPGWPAVGVFDRYDFCSPLMAKLRTGPLLVQIARPFTYVNSPITSDVVTFPQFSPTDDDITVNINENGLDRVVLRNTVLFKDSQTPACQFYRTENSSPWGVTSNPGEILQSLQINVNQLRLTGSIDSYIPIPRKANGSNSPDEGAFVRVTNDGLYALDPATGIIIDPWDGQMQRVILSGSNSGTSRFYSRSDHVHGLDTTLTVNSLDSRISQTDPAQAKSAGTDIRSAASDHRHSITGVITPAQLQVEYQSVLRSRATEPRVVKWGGTNASAPYENGGVARVLPFNLAQLDQNASLYVGVQYGSNVKELFTTKSQILQKAAASQGHVPGASSAIRFDPTKTGAYNSGWTVGHDPSGYLWIASPINLRHQDVVVTTTVPILAQYGPYSNTQGVLKKTAGVWNNAAGTGMMSNSDANLFRQWIVGGLIRDVIVKTEIARSNNHAGLTGTYQQFSGCSMNVGFDEKLEDTSTYAFDCPAVIDDLTTWNASLTLAKHGVSVASNTALVNIRLQGYDSNGAASVAFTFEGR